ncbi:MAG TPA: hypothetical protein VKR83_04915 [Ktedonobacteraceae bacterium]|nr:hypothetical protein [Ktedonobacteraceae bacterium]
MTDAATTRSNTPPQPPPDANDEERSKIPPWSPLYGAGMGASTLPGSGQAYTPGAPAVQGTPQIGGVPHLAGSPTPFANTPPMGNLAQGSIAPPPPQAPTYPGANTYYPHAGQEPPQAYPHYPPEHREHGEHQAHHAQHLHHAATATKVAGGSAIKTIIIVVAAVVVVAAGGIGAAAYFLTRPQPLISLTSSYKLGSNYAGASGTTLHISGQKFSGNSAITFLLDGSPAPGSPSARSDSNGNFQADVKITPAWTVGTHALTARDASNYSTKNTVTVVVVQAGVANTPGPNGAPPDDATFTLNLTAHGTYNSVNQAFTRSETLNVTGHPDPAGGTTCQNGDNGQKFTDSGVTLDTNIPYSETYAFTCQGSYKSGKISYTETLISDVITYTNGSGISCTLIAPQVNQLVSGSYSSQNEFSGTFNYEPVPRSDFRCTNANSYFAYTGGQATWTGTVSGLKS